MLQLLFALNAPIENNNPLIIETETAMVQPVEETKELTLEEKIGSNFYKCDESIYWISAEDASCLPKRTRTVTKTTTTQEPVRTAVNASSGWFPYGQCTWYVSTRRSVGQWNNATDWKWQAQRDGHTISSTPIAGAIAWNYGHVAYVESVSGDRMTISEANYDYNGSIRTITIPISSYSAFIY